MFGAKRRIRQYLDVIRPWAAGVDNRGWLWEDFHPEKARKDRLEPTAVIFPIAYAPLQSFDALFLNKKQYEAYLALRQHILKFNSTLAVLNSVRRDLQDTYYGLICLLHAGVIGTKGSGGLHDAVARMEEVLQ